MASVLITEEKIDLVDLEQEYSSIAFDISIKTLYLQRIRTVLHNRSSLLTKISQHTLISNKLIDQFSLYYTEALQLQQIKEIKEIRELQEHIDIYHSKIPYFTEYMQLKYK